MEVDGAVAWPFAFGGELSERFEWLTDVLDPPIGPPQTRKLNDSPRVVLSFEGLEDGARRGWLENLLHANGSGRWHVPLGADRSALIAAAAAGSTSLAVTTTQRRFVEGGNAILVGADPRQHEVVEIVAVVDGAITLASPTAAAWPTGTAVFPTVACRLDGAPVLERFTADAAPYAVSFRVDEPMDWAADFGGASYRGFPVLEWDLDWSTEPTWKPDRRLSILDSGVGGVAQFDLSRCTRPLVSFALALESRAQVAAFRSLLYALSGRWSPIWVPSYGRDLEVQAVVSDTQLDVAWSGLSDWPLRPERRDIRIARAGSAPIYRRITTATGVDADTERLQFDTALPVGFAAGDVTGVSFMALSLQEADVNVMRVWSSEVMLADLAFRGFDHDY